MEHPEALDSSRIMGWLGNSSLSACTKDDRFTVLHACCYSGNTQLIQAMMKSNLDHGSDVGLALDLRTSNGLAPLHLAAKHGHLEIVNLLLKEFSVPVDATAKGGRTPLMLAVKEQAAGWKEIASVLVEHGADGQLKARAGFSALSLALMYGGLVGTGLAGCLDKLPVDQVSGLCVHGLIIDCTGLITTLIAWGMPGDSSTVNTVEFQRLDKLIANGADVNAPLPQRQTTALALAVHPGAVQRLLKAGARVGARDVDGNTPLHCIISMKLPEELKLSAVRILLEHGAEYKDSALNKLHKSPYDLSAGSIRQLLDAEELRRKVDYEQIQKQWEEQAALKLSAVEALLKQPIEQKRGAVKDHISTMTAKMIARREKSTQISEATEPAQLLEMSSSAPKATWGQGYSLSPWELYLCKAAVGTIARLEQSIRTLVIQRLHEIAHGDWQHATALGSSSSKVKLRQTLLLKGACIVWEVGIMFSARQSCYTDAIKIWSIEADVSNVHKVPTSTAFRKFVYCAVIFPTNFDWGLPTSTTSASNTQRYWSE